MRILELFDLNQTIAKDYLSSFRYPHEALGGLTEFVQALLSRLPKEEYVEMASGVLVHKTAIVAPSAVLEPPCIVCARSQIRQGAYIRGSVIVGEDCVVGNSTELKNAVLFNGVQVPHYNYIGDSILGYKAHFGAGAITSNLKSDRSIVFLLCDGERLFTGRKKVGAFVGDRAEIGCNAVLCPGSIVGRRAVVYPLSLVRGTVEEDCIFKGNGKSVKKEER